MQSAMQKHHRRPTSQNRFTARLFSLLLLALLNAGCGPANSFETEWGELRIAVDFEPAEDGLYSQTIQLRQHGQQQQVVGKTTTQALDIHSESVDVGQGPVEAICIYDLYLGWALLRRDDLSLLKDFKTLPKGNVLLQQLRSMDNPALRLRPEHGFVQMRRR